MDLGKHGKLGGLFPSNAILARVKQESDGKMTTDGIEKAHNNISYSFSAAENNQYNTNNQLVFSFDIAYNPVSSHQLLICAFFLAPTK